MLAAVCFHKSSFEVLNFFFLKLFLGGLFICIFSPLLSMNYDNLEKILEKTFAISNNVRIFDPIKHNEVFG